MAREVAKDSRLCKFTELVTGLASFQLAHPVVLRTVAFESLNDLPLLRQCREMSYLRVERWCNLYFLRAYNHPALKSKFAPLYEEPSDVF